MIADLKADSERWDKERRQTASGTRGPSNGIPVRDSDDFVRSNRPPVGYRESTTHQSRQYYGPSEPMSGPPQGGYVPATAGPVIYNDGSPYPPQQQPLQQQNYSQQPSASGYQQPGYPAGQDYYAGANYSAAEPSPARVPVSQAGVNVPRTSANNVSYAVTPTYQQPDNRGPYYSNQTQVPVSSGPAYPSQQPQDPYYGRGAYYHETKPPIYIEKRELSNFLATPATDPMYAQDTYDTRPNYQESGSYSQTQAPVSQSVPAVVPNTSSRREHHPEPRERHGHRNNNRRN